MPAVHAPHRMTVAGKVYEGGEFIPGDAQDAATPEERQALGLPDTSATPGQAGRLHDHARAVLGDKYDPERFARAAKAHILRRGYNRGHREALEVLAGERPDEFGVLNEEEEGEEDQDEEEEEEEEPDASPTREFADGYFDAQDTALGRLNHFHDAADDLDPDDPAFTPDLQTALAADFAEAWAEDPESAVNAAATVLADYDYDPGDPRVAAVMRGLAQLPAAPPVPFDPSKKNVYCLLDTEAILDDHKKAAAKELLRVLGHSAEANGAAVVPFRLGGKGTLWGDYLDGGDHFELGQINAEDDAGLSLEEEAAHAALFDGLSGRPLIAEASAPASAKNFGRVSAGENVEIEADWNPDEHDVYKPVTKGWYLLRRGTANAGVESRDAEMYSFVPRSKVGQLVSLPPQYWEHMTAGLTQGDADSDAAERRAAKADRDSDTVTTGDLRRAKEAVRPADRAVGAARDLANRIRGMDARGEALEGAADEMADLKHDDLIAPLSPAGIAESDRLQEARDAAIRRHGLDPQRDWGGRVLPDDPRWKAEHDAYFAHDIGPDPDHPATPHYDILHDALDDLRGDAGGWRGIDTGAIDDDLRRARVIGREDYGTDSPDDARHVRAQQIFDASHDAARGAAEARGRLQVAADAYDDHFGRMAGHLRRVRDAAAAVVPHVADDEERTAALKKVHTVATRHLKRLARAGHFTPPDGYEMAWVPYHAKIKPRGVGKKKGDRIGWRDEETGRVVYGTRKPGERKKAAPKAAPPPKPPSAPAEPPEQVHARVTATLAAPTVAGIGALAGDLPKLTRDALRAMVKARGLKVGGRKHELATRLVAHAKSRAPAPPAPGAATPVPTDFDSGHRREVVMDAVGRLGGLPPGVALTVGSVRRALADAGGLDASHFAAAAGQLQTLGIVRVANTAHGQVFEAGPKHGTVDPRTGQPTRPGILADVGADIGKDARALARTASAVGRRLVSGLRHLFGGKS